jgi:integrase
MAKRLTDISIRNLKPGPVRREISDAGSGLYLVQQPSGHQSWAVRYRAAGRPIKLTLGSWPQLSLHDARAAAAETLKQVKLGNDPARARQDAKVKADAAKADTLTAVCENYLKREGGKLRTLDQRISILRRLIYPVLGDKPIGSIKRSEIVAMLDKIEDHNGPRAADVALGVLRRILHWHEQRTDEFRSPVIRGMGNRQDSVEHRRTRILDDDELRAVWAAASADAGPFGGLVQFLLLTSARRNEAAGMKWDEVDVNNVWTLPASRSKTKTEIARPLSKAAQEILAEQPRIDGCDYVFTSTGIGPFKSCPHGKLKLDAAAGVTGYRLHDLRRTARSLLSRAGVNSDIAERCLGHAIGGVRGVYDRHRYVAEMAHAFEALAALIDRIVINPPAGEIADIVAERSKRQPRRSRS